MSLEYGPRRSASRWQRRLRGVGAAIALAVLSALAAALITSQSLGSLTRSVSGVVDDSEPKRVSVPVRATDQLFKQIENGPFWHGPPRMLEKSRRYLADHFLALNPWQPHGDLKPRLPVLPPWRLATEAPLFAGRQITLIGRVRYLTVGGTAFGRWPGGRNLIYQAQIGEGNRADPLVYCEFSEASVHRLRPGQLVVAIGVPIADGAVSLSKGGFAQSAYMVGAMVRPIRNAKEVFEALQLSKA
jgi:hypothetical protein